MTAETHLAEQSDVMNSMEAILFTVEGAEAEHGVKSGDFLRRAASNLFDSGLFPLQSAIDANKKTPAMATVLFVDKDPRDSRFGIYVDRGGTMWCLEEDEGVVNLEPSKLRVAPNDYYGFFTKPAILKMIDIIKDNIPAQTQQSSI